MQRIYLYRYIYAVVILNATQKPINDAPIRVSARKNVGAVLTPPGLQIEGVLAYFTHLKRIGDDVGDFKYVFTKKKNTFSEPELSWIMVHIAALCRLRHQTGKDRGAGKILGNF
jgi:hypothetical protein